MALKGTKAKNRRVFVYSFSLLDSKTRLYITYGMSFGSDNGAFDRAMEKLKQIGVDLGGVRFDRHYSFPSYVDRFGKAKVYVIPRKNATMRESWKWKETMKEFVKNTISYLQEYYLRNHSEAGFPVDKRWFWWRIWQRREDRISTAYACAISWHNLFNFYSR